MINKRTTMTKSLHTVTVVSRVALLLMGQQRYKRGQEHKLALDALQVLGFTVAEHGLSPTDDTVARCVAACKKLIDSV